MPALAWGLVFGGVWASVFCNPLSISAEWTAASAGAFAFLVLFGTMFAFWSFLAGLRHVSPVVAGLLNSAELLAGYFFSMLFLGDVLGFWQTAGIALVIANVALLAFRKN